jgi:predicted benzoate:H+ symporter BenE
MTNWQSFWAVIAVFLVCEMVLTLHGIDTFFWRFKTPTEQAIQQKLSGGCKP